MQFVIAQDRQREPEKKRYLMIEDIITVYTAATILVQMPHYCHYHPASYKLPINAKYYPWYSGEKDFLFEEEERWEP